MEQKSEEKSELRVCQRCGEAKPLSEYRTWGHVKSKGGVTYSKTCRKCYSLIRQEAMNKKKAEGIPKNRMAKLFAFWLSLPGIAKDQKYIEQALIPKLDPHQQSLIKDLVECDTIAQVANVLNVEYHTLARWKKNKAIKKMVEFFDKNNDAVRFKRDVDYSFSRATIKHADAARVKLWYQLYQGFVEKSSQTHELDEQNIAAIQEKLKNIAEQPKQLDAPYVLQDLPTTVGSDDEEPGSDQEELRRRQAYRQNSV